MTKQMKPTLIGFDGPEPYAIVIVQPIGANRFKQVCYSYEELQLVFKRFTVAENYTLEVLMNEPELEEVI